MKAVLLAVLVLRVTPTADAFRQSAMATMWSSEKQASCCSLQAQHTCSAQHALRPPSEGTGPLQCGPQYASACRRAVLTHVVPAFCAALWAPRDASAMKRPACGDVETCAELGEKRFQAAEAEKGAIVKLDGGVRYRELQRGTGEGADEGDVVDITFQVHHPLSRLRVLRSVLTRHELQVLKGNGFYMYSLGLDKEPGLKDLGETFKLTLGDHQVPVAVELALQGAKKGCVRRVELPPRLGFETSQWSPEPSTFEGRQRMEAYRQRLKTTKGYAGTPLLFEFTVARIRPAATDD